jgi:hypothetical protein
MISALYKLAVIISNTIECYKISLFMSILYYFPQLSLAIQKKQPVFIVHHAISGGLSAVALFQRDIFMYKVYFDFMTVMDLSGLFIDIYKMTPESPYTRKALCIGYIPIRCVIAPYILLSNPPFDSNSLVAAVGYWGLVFGSYIWSYKLLDFTKFNMRRK